jgi:hypothetical protein
LGGVERRRLLRGQQATELGFKAAIAAAERLEISMRRSPAQG